MFFQERGKFQETRPFSETVFFLKIFVSYFFGLQCKCKLLKLFSQFELSLLPIFVENISGDGRRRPLLTLKGIQKASINRFFLGVLETRFGSLELKIGSPESEKIIIGSLESEKSGPYRFTSGT